MTITVALHHTTHYTYDKHIMLGPQIIRLRPTPNCRVPVDSYSLKISPGKHFLNWQQDPFNNFLAQVVIPEKTHEFKIEVDLLAKINAINPFQFFLEDNIKEYPFYYDQDLAQQLYPYFQITEGGQYLKKWLSLFNQKKQSTIDFLVNLNKHVNEYIGYVIRLEHGVQDCETTLALKTGSCRDMAWLLCQAFRHFGLASRFTSGYLIQLKEDEPTLEGPLGPIEDLCDLHAWTEVYIPGAGWVGLDPTSGLLIGEGHIPLCASPTPQSAAPVSGILDQCYSEMTFQMDVQRILEEPRVTKPYLGQEWQAIQSLAARVDENLQKNNVKLTMGGEPTFVALDDKESAQWQTAALSDEKKQLSLQLLKRLKHKFTKGSVIQFGQGKWYGGEVLPRWSLDCYWRLDGEAIWCDEHLLVFDQPQKNTIQDSRKFIDLLTQALGLHLSYISLAYESMTSEPITPVGYVLPLFWSSRTQGWRSQSWQSRFKSLKLVPGDSPIGLRLPLEQLFQEDADDEVELDKCGEKSLFEEVPPLPLSSEYFQWFKTRTQQQLNIEPCLGVIKTALCLELRENTLCVFIPPITQIEHYLELIAAIEWTAQQLKIPVMIEGYAPPQDTRLQCFKITPDPGVIEVNIQPSKNWEELVETVNTVYQEAKQTRLTTEKFLMDGRQVSTGGGNHLTLGGPTPAESPFLRRPDLLQSMITFWQHHPSLSYLFSGLFIGPTSQSPRIDEARHESLYELEIAFSQMTDQGTDQLWQVDRLLRNLLVDITGNTHRAEFCIDKLYSPSSQSGRQGLLELRAFEMPPNAQMCLVQYLLVRALVASFWQQPYRHRMVRWGTALHDRFMLPHCIWQDLGEVIHYLHESGYHFLLDWLKPFLSFRFPHYGSVNINHMEMSVHMALEPWHVLGEDNYFGATSRGVDSALERVQLQVKHFNSDRYIVTCNNQRLPLHATDKKGEYVAGVRFKAWNAVSTLHPNIPVHAPLIFDIVDCYYQRSIGGCTYYSSPPGGQAYETLPINAREAQSRVRARFEPFGHTPGIIKMAPLIENPEYPYTLDLRYCMGDPTANQSS